MQQGKTVSVCVETRRSCCSCSPWFLILIHSSARPPALIRTRHVDDLQYRTAYNGKGHHDHHIGRAGDRVSHSMLRPQQIHLTHSPSSLRIWAKETPQASRNFLQLCMEGYYDDLTFHRLVPGFIVQGGDPTGTGTGGESVYGQPFIDEPHQRLKFNRRGLLACANEGDRDTNGSQFFVSPHANLSAVRC